KLMVRKEVASAPADGHIDQPPEGLRRVVKPEGSVFGMQIEDDSCVTLFGPCEKALLVALDEANGPVDHIYAVPAEVLARLLHEGYKGISWNEYLGDDLGRAHRSEPPIYAPMVIVQIAAHLKKIGPVYLSRS